MRINIKINLKNRQGRTLMGAIMTFRVGAVKCGVYVDPLNDCQQCRSLYLAL